ncbi:WecB/TagA/CpsF family glycosyltransferase [Streptococcus pyogenes]|uniref:WecB/TagA/CpsF family glycosyltransferase n=1 Tax=Streptococcus pyogenes TaxID=1314 RepID=UPI003DA0EAA1
MTAAQDHAFAAVLQASDLNAADGFPVAWMLRRLGFAGQHRVSGPDVMWELCRAAERLGLPVYFYGSAVHVLDSLVENLKRHFPDLQVAGFYSPPFRTLSEAEQMNVARAINESGARIVLVSLGCPKQETWMAAQKSRISAVMLGVGAAFDFHAGTLRRAPPWMRRVGLEWAFRLGCEPRRLWRRYLVTNTLFLWLAGKQFLSRRAGR